MELFSVPYMSWIKLNKSWKFVYFTTHACHIRQGFCWAKVRIQCGHISLYRSVFYVALSLFKSSFSHLCSFPCNVHHSKRSEKKRNRVWIKWKKEILHSHFSLSFNRFFSPLFLWIDFFIGFFIGFCNPYSLWFSFNRHAKNAGHWLLNFYKISISSVWLSINFDSSWASQTHERFFHKNKKSLKWFVFWHSDHFRYLYITDNGMVGHVKCPIQGQNKQNLLLFVLFVGWKTV